MAFNLKNKSKDPISEINVTPFVDVMLVLLIVFMVTAPLLTVGVQVDLPESAADSLPDDQEPLTLSINSIESFFLLIRSFVLPGVPTTICAPFFKARIWTSILAPP